MGHRSREIRCGGFKRLQARCHRQKIDFGDSPPVPLDCEPAFSHHAFGYSTWCGLAFLACTPSLSTLAPLVQCRSSARLACTPSLSRADQPRRARSRRRWGCSSASSPTTTATTTTTTTTTTTATRVGHSSHILAWAFAARHMQVACGPSVCPAKRMTSCPARRSSECARRGPFDFTPIGANSISFGSPHVRPMGALSTCGA